MVGKCVPVHSRGGVVQISNKKRLIPKLQAVVYLFTDKRPPFTYGGKQYGTIKRGENYYTD